MCRPCRGLRLQHLSPVVPLGAPPPATLCRPLRASEADFCSKDEKLWLDIVHVSTTGICALEQRKIAQSQSNPATLRGAELRRRLPGLSSRGSLNRPVTFLNPSGVLGLCFWKGMVQKPGYYRHDSSMEI
jgi:hypothetical protein